MAIWQMIIWVALEILILMSVWKAGSHLSQVQEEISHQVKTSCVILSCSILGEFRCYDGICSIYNFSYLFTANGVDYRGNMIEGWYPGSCLGMPYDTTCYYQNNQKPPIPSLKRKTDVTAISVFLSSIALVIIFVAISYVWYYMCHRHREVNQLP